MKLTSASTKPITVSQISKHGLFVQDKSQAQIDYRNYHVLSSSSIFKLIAMHRVGEIANEKYCYILNAFIYNYNFIGEKINFGIFTV